MQLPAVLLDWLEQATGDTVVRAHRIPGGGVREGWFVDFQKPSGDLIELFLRCSQVPLPENAAFHSLAAEACVVAALGDAGVPVPRVHAVHPSREAVLLDRVAGDTWFSQIKSEVQQVRVAKDFVRSLAATHRLHPDSLGLDEVLGPARSAREIALERIADLRRRGARADGTLDPLVDLSADWLEANVPDYDGPVVLVQGDTGPGNFLYQGDRVTAVLDWELCHWGDPMDDIAWLTLRAVQDTFTHVPDRLREYAELSGHAIDMDRIWYYRVFAETTMATLNTHDMDDTNQVRDTGTAMIYHQLHQRLWVNALDQVMGLGLAGSEVPLVHGTPPEWDWLYAEVDGMLKEIGRRVEDPLTKRWNGGVFRAVRYLRELDAHGREAHAQWFAAIEKLVPGPHADLAGARVAVDAARRDGTVSNEDYVRYLWPVIYTQDHLMRSASGVLATRDWPALVDP